MSYFTVHWLHLNRTGEASEDLHLFLSVHSHMEAAGYSVLHICAVSRSICWFLWQLYSSPFNNITASRLMGSALQRALPFAMMFTDLLNSEPYCSVKRMVSSSISRFFNVTWNPLPASQMAPCSLHGVFLFTRPRAIYIQNRVPFGMHSWTENESGI